MAVATRPSTHAPEARRPEDTRSLHRGGDHISQLRTRTSRTPAREEDEEPTPREGRPGPDIRSASRRAERVVAIYLVAGSAWVVLSVFLADWFATRAVVPRSTLELTSGLVFVVTTAYLLRRALRQWTRRVTDAAVAQAHAAEAERRAADRIRDAEAVRSRFLRNISHELRTPLTNIVGYGTTISSRLTRLRPAEAQRMADRLVVNAQRLQQLVLEMLDIDQRGQGYDEVQREPVRLDHLAAQVLDAIRLPCHVVRMEADAATARLDRAKTARILDELVRNATRHTPAGTHVQVELRLDGDHVLIAVEDDGPGIPAELLPHVFDPFLQGPDVDAAASPGVGIGLSVVERYAQAHGGHVSADNGVSGGARFTVSIPLPRSEA